MKPRNILKTVAAVVVFAVLIVAAYKIGRNDGINHVLDTASYCNVDAICTNYMETMEGEKRTYRFEKYVDPTGAEYDTSIYILLDGEIYEQGLYIG